MFPFFWKPFIDHRSLISFFIQNPQFTAQPLIWISTLDLSIIESISTGLLKQRRCSLHGMLFALWLLAIVIALACLRILGEPVSPIVRRPGFLRLSFTTINLGSIQGSYLCEQQSDSF
jgi:hypothetical protein